MQDPAPIQALCDMLAYLCHAEQAKNPSLGPAPTSPSGEWAIDAARSIFDVPHVYAEIVVGDSPDEELTAGDALESLGAERGPMLDAVIG